MKQKIYKLIASDEFMCKDYDSILCICDEKHLERCAKRILKNEGCSINAIYAQLETLLDKKQLSDVYRKISRNSMDYDETSMIESFTLRIEEVNLNEVEEY